ncbi:MAG TPA: ABC transporter permease [Bryobacteraceae bacterium]|nr:ABC transporter permease [Bryobacteraceae bacterium]
MATLWRDFRYAFRVLLKSPGFSIVVILSLALGIGANTAIFSIVNAFLLRPMPVDDPDRLVAVYLTAPRWANDIGNFSYSDLLDYRKQNTGFSDLMGSTGLPLTMTDGEKPELIWGEIVTGNYFSGLGVHPIAGRGFLPDEDHAPGEKPVCVLNYNFWRRHFQGDPNIAGRTIKINGHAFTVVGVAPRGFIGTTLFQFIPDVWVPVMMQQTIAPGNYLEGRGNRWIALRGRLKPGVTRRQAEAAMNGVAQQLARAYPRTNRDVSVHLIAGGARVQPFLVARGAVSVTTGIMAGVVILVLLIACANVANLMMVRSTARAKEMAIRVAVGASRGRLVRQLLTESVLLSLAGGVLGILFALWFGDQTRHFYPSLDFQTADLDYDARLDPKIFPFTFLISLVTSVLFGLLPALRASKVDQVSAMKGEAASVPVGRSRIGRGNLLVMAQVALSCVLLICGGLFLRSMQFANNTDPGFYRTGISMFSVDLDLQGYNKARGLIFQQDMINRLRSISGVDAASIATPLPLDAYDSSTLVLPEGYVPRSDREDNSAGLSRVGPHYFDTMGTKLVAGRPIDERDTATSPRVAVVNETLARRYWQTPERAIGRRFAIDKEGTYVQVVGVAKNGKYNTYGEGAVNYYFCALTQDYSGRATFLIRSRQNASALTPAIRRQVASLDAALPIFGVRTMPEFLNRLVSIYDMGASLVGTFAIMALLLAAVGIFGVLHFTVARRTREIGIRMALGAQAGEVLRLVLQRSLLWVTGGIVIGVAIAFSVGGITGQLLAGVSGTDPVTFAAVAILFAGIAFAASILPARRATRVDPIRALRYE